ncbi:MAG: hypothetical protein N2111_09480 [Candidatus Sumerlaeaceae bacterium]|nr:hypothetical protein [Candidatus Sumerlaeaceae bacterium]
MPRLVRRVLWVSVGLSLPLFCYWVLVDRASGLAFGAAAAWGVANLCVWAALIRASFSKHRLRRLFRVLLIVAKLSLLAGGVIALYASRPHSAAMLLAVVLGVSMVLVSAVLTAGGAWLMGLDLAAEDETVPKQSALEGDRN